MEERARLACNGFLMKPREAEFLAQIARAARELDCRCEITDLPSDRAGDLFRNRGHASCEAHMQVSADFLNYCQVGAFVELGKAGNQHARTSNTYPVNMTLVIYFGQERARFRSKARRKVSELEPKKSLA